MTRWNSLPKKYQTKGKYAKILHNKAKNNKLIIPGELPTENEIINVSKAHWSKYKRMKDTHDKIVAFFAEKQNIPFYESVELEIVYYRKNKRTDPDNICAGKKFILDGLVKAGVLEEDGWKQVKGFKESWKVDKENPRVEIEFNKF